MTLSQRALLSNRDEKPGFASRHRIARCGPVAQVYAVVTTAYELSVSRSIGDQHIWGRRALSHTK
jgi:hypothetical protein